MIALAIMVLCLPVAMWFVGSRSFRSLSFLEQNLTRAGNGAAVAVLALMCLGLFHSKYDLQLSAPLAMILEVLALFSFARAIYGVRHVWGNGDGALAFRAFWRLTAGAIGAYLLHDAPSVRSASPSFICTTLYVLSWWWLIGGGVRFLLMVNPADALPKKLPTRFAWLGRIQWRRVGLIGGGVLLLALLPVVGWQMRAVAQPESALSKAATLPSVEPDYPLESMAPNTPSPRPSASVSVRRALPVTKSKKHHSEDY
jgi:hypothetical protein